MEKTEHVFVTDSLKLAMALTAAGFAIRRGEQIIKDDRPMIVCELDPYHNGIKALHLKECFENKHDLAAQINGIIETRGITQEEYVLLAFDAARCGLHNRSTVIYAINKNRPLVHKEIGNGRALIYREGTPRATIKTLIDNA
jgi:hypothetical protein